ncbi:MULTISPECIES: hypothetical protein [Gammaproteobacteria]|uniref:hypothetical protein n=1 Tax=Gammaproteobacteria TaxID=1236 RepID=UPI001912CC07|nr:MULTISPECIES: hypothetical protein [Gammaproteobacteria]MBK5301712.1 hypothetical protein [Bacillus sp. TH86]MBK5321481.1 hypothetical protein [Bacillus sp. TH59]MBK5336431.1 hypothetical protein [Bacillus sp. TH57]MBK5315979.1 hypothetical protein [Erwinia sp. TH79]MBK5420839.1 hypothetical protein [Erwinia sp. TH29]
MVSPNQPNDLLAAEEPPSSFGATDEPPKVPAVIEQDDPNGLLPRSALGARLAVTFTDFKQGVGPDEEDWVELGFMPVGTPFRRVDDRWYPNADPIGFPQTLFVPQELLSIGIYEVSVRVSISGVNPKESPRKKLTIDTQPPNFGGKPDAVVFPAELDGTITETYLTEHGQVIVDVPWYIDVMAGDRAPYFWTDRELPPDHEIPIREQEFSQEDIDNKRLLITVYADEIRPWGEGKRYLYYSLRDRAGNTGPRSYLADINVDLTPAPGQLPPPKVPLPRGLVDRQQARDDVQVEIDQYDFADPGHWVAIFWDDTPLAEFPVDPAAPITATVPWPTLHAKGDGPLRAKVYYKIRQGSAYGPPSPDISVAVDLTLAGQDHDKAPARTNEDLAFVEVYGEKSGIRNSLLTEDHGYPAKVLLNLYNAPKPDEVLELYWGNYPGPVARYDVKVGDVAGAPIEFTVPWEVIDTDKQNPALPVSYTTSNGVNEQQSLPTPVKVAIIWIENLKEPTFPHGGLHGVLHCCSRPRLWEGVTVRVKADPRIEQGDRLILVWQGCAGLNGTDPIDGAYDEIVKELTTLQPGEDIDIVVADYDRLIAPMVNNGSGLAYYKLEKHDGGRGVSKSEFVVINRTMPSGEVCSPEKDLCNEN